MDSPSRPVPGIGDALDIRQGFFTNVLLLGLNTTAMENRYKIPFNKDMFLLPNKKAFEAVMYFLFNKLNPVLCREQFRDCWPVGDKKQEQQFRKNVNNWLTHIAKDEPDAHLPRVVASLFLSPGGDRFYQMIFAFSKFVLFKQVLDIGIKERDLINHPSINSQNHSIADVIGCTLQAVTVRHRRRLLDVAQDAVLLHKQWKEAASEFVKENRKLSKAIRQREEDVRRESAKAVHAGFGSPAMRKTAIPDLYHQSFDTQSVKRAQKVSQLRDMWKDVDNYCESKLHERSVVESILKGVVNMHKIDAADINVQIPDVLLRECEQELHRRNVGNMYREGKLDILSLIQLWNLSMHLYIDKLHEVGVPSFDEQAASILTQVHTHHAHFANAQELRSHLGNEMLPDLRKSVHLLKSRHEASKTTPHSSRTNSSVLNLLPATPVMSFDEESTLKAAQTPTTLRDMRQTRDLVSTPEAVGRLTKSVQQSVHKTSVPQGTPLYGPKMEFRGRPAGSNFLQPSKLPGPDYTYEKQGDRQRTRVRSAPQKMMSFDIPITPQRRMDHKPHIKASGQSIDVSADKTPPMSSTRSVRDHLTEQVTKTKPVFKKPVDKGKRPATRKASAKAQEKSSRIPAPNKSYKAHDILAEQVADAVLYGDMLVTGGSSRSSTPSSGPDEMNLRDPLAGLGAAAFEHRDKLARTPGPNSVRKPTWRDTLLKDDEEARDHVTRDLFTPTDSVEENIITVGEAESTNAFTSNRRSHEESRFTSEILRSPLKENQQYQNEDTRPVESVKTPGYPGYTNSKREDADAFSTPGNYRAYNFDAGKENAKVSRDEQLTTPSVPVRTAQRFDLFQTPSDLLISTPTPARSQHTKQRRHDPFNLETTTGRSSARSPSSVSKPRSPPSGFMSPGRRSRAENRDGEVHQRETTPNNIHVDSQRTTSVRKGGLLDEEDDLLVDISMPFSPMLDLQSMLRTDTPLKKSGSRLIELETEEDVDAFLGGRDTVEESKTNIEGEELTSLKGVTESIPTKECWVEKNENLFENDTETDHAEDMSPPLVSLKSQGTKRSKEGSESERSVTAEDIISRYKKLKLGSARDRTQEHKETEGPGHIEVDNIKDRLEKLTVNEGKTNSGLNERYLTRSPDKLTTDKQDDYGYVDNLENRDNLRLSPQDQSSTNVRRFKLDLDDFGSPAISPPQRYDTYRVRTDKFGTGYQSPGGVGTSSQVPNSSKKATTNGQPLSSTSTYSYTLDTSPRLKNGRHSAKDFLETYDRVMDSVDLMPSLENFEGLLDDNDSILLPSTPDLDRIKDRSRSILTSEPRNQLRTPYEFTGERRVPGSRGDFILEPETDTLIDF